MYNIGTVTTIANSTKLIGVGTKWKENISLIAPQQQIQIQIGTTIHNNSIQSIQSNTELTLNFPFPAAAAGSKYVIFNTTFDSISAAANSIVAMNISNVQFSDVLNRIMTESGVITITLPDGTVMQTRTEKERDKLLDAKFDKSGGEVSGDLSVTGVNLTIGKDASMLQFKAGALVPEPFVNYRTKATWYQQYFQSKSGTLMHVRDFGIGAIASVTATAPTVGDMNTLETSGFYGASGAGSLNAFNQTSPCISAVRNGGGSGTGMVLQIQAKANGSIGTRFRSENVWSAWIENYNVTNTTKDANGNLKAASPIVKVFADHIENNDESEGVTLKKLYTGIYQLHGVLGLHSDASWGGINGGITIPCGINQLPLVYVLYDVLGQGKPHPFDGRIVEPDEDGDIVLYTTYRKHDLPQNIQYERFKLYPEFLKEVDGKKVELTPGEPCDIPVGHWVDVRVNMPSNSLYNQKQAEAERLAKIEAE